MAKLVYDGREYAVPDEDVMNVAEAVLQLAQGRGGWLLLGHPDAGARLLIGLGGPVAIHVGDAALDTDEAIDESGVLHN